MDKKKAVLLLHDYQEKGESYRSLAKRYGVIIGTVHNMVKKVKEANLAAQPAVPYQQEREEAPMPEDVKALKEELRRARLKIELLDAVIDISSKELGIDLRKKHGTRQP